MKKTLSVILVAVMLLSTLVALVVPAAASEDNNWAVYLTATVQDMDEEGKSKAPPLPGYYYDETGFHTKSPDYTNYNPKFTVISKEKYNIENFSMEVIVHDYAISGDNWLSFSIWSESNGIDQGGTSGRYGDGWTSLIRGNPATGTLNLFESWNATIGGRQNVQQFTNIDGTQTNYVIFDEVINEDGDRVFTLTIEEGVMKINGVAVGDGTNKLIADRFTEGLAYVGVTLHNTDATGTYQPTLTISKVNGEVPTGNESAEPESKIREYGPEIDPSTVLENTPAIWFDATMEATNTSMPQSAGCNLGYADDNKSFLVELYQNSFQIHFAVPDKITHMAENYTYVAVLYKNFCVCNLEEGQTAFENCSRDGATHQTTVWYFSGVNTSANSNGVIQAVDYYCINPVNEDGSSATEDYYTAVVFKLSNPDYWQGRIHGFRLDVNGLSNFADEGHNTIEVLGAGFFKSGSDVAGYIESIGYNPSTIAEDYFDCTVDGCKDADGDGYCDSCWEVVDPAITGDECEECVDENGDNVCDVCGKELEEESSSENESKPAENGPQAEANTNSNASSDDSAEEKKGCKSAVSMGALAVVAILGTGLVIKKKED